MKRILFLIFLLPSVCFSSVTIDQVLSKMGYSQQSKVKLYRGEVYSGGQGTYKFSVLWFFAVKNGVLSKCCVYFKADEVVNVSPFVPTLIYSRRYEDPEDSYYNVTEHYSGEPEGEPVWETKSLFKVYDYDIDYEGREEQHPYSGTDVQITKAILNKKVSYEGFTDLGGIFWYNDQIKIDVQKVYDSAKSK